MRGGDGLTTWDSSTWISVLALAMSGLSFLAAAWAAWVSHRALRHAENVHHEDRRIAFERERSQLLEIINNSRSLLDKTRIRIGELKADFDAAPQPAQVLMHNYTSLFTEYLPRVEAGVRQAKQRCCGTRSQAGTKTPGYMGSFAIRLSFVRFFMRIW